MIRLSASKSGIFPQSNISKSRFSHDFPVFGGFSLGKTDQILHGRNIWIAWAMRWSTNRPGIDGKRGFTQAMVKTWDLTLVKSWEKMGKNQPQNLPQRDLDGFHMIWTIEDDETWCFGHETLGLYPWIDNRDSVVMFCSKNGEWFPNLRP